ncbi:MAG TPA: hypothetical protein VFB38_17405 [Chthonomonadaceae bacterium]|nr:hypothetical protein [Chthonomonadaceae bacterium]
MKCGSWAVALSAGSILGVVLTRWFLRLRRNRLDSYSCKIELQHGDIRQPQDNSERTSDTSALSEQWDKEDTATPLPLPPPNIAVVVASLPGEQGLSEPPKEQQTDSVPDVANTPVAIIEVLPGPPFPSSPVDKTVSYPPNVTDSSSADSIPATNEVAAKTAIQNGKGLSPSVGLKPSLRPDQHGGGGRGRAQDLLLKPRERATVKQATLLPELVCRNLGRKWLIALEVPEKFANSATLTVRQNGNLLEADERLENGWLLHATSGLLDVYSETESRFTTEVGSQGYLIFKLSGANADEGRLVDHPATGRYLVVAPDNWERDEKQAGPASIEPEFVSLDGCLAHFFEITKHSESRIAFITPNGGVVSPQTKSSHFELVGHRIKDARDDVGPLFGKQLPCIRARHARDWEEVSTIVVGEEGIGEGRWRMQFPCNPIGKDQQLPLDVAARKSGWFFLRFYDANNRMMESIDFRYLAFLDAIDIRQPAPVPPPEGHGEVYVTFMHQFGCDIQRAKGMPQNIEIAKSLDSTLVAIPADPNCDETRWHIRQHNGAETECLIRIERLWWSFGQQKAWSDQPVALSRHDLSPTSEEVLYLRLPVAGWADKIAVGFEYTRARQLLLKRTDDTVSIRLSELCDVEERQKVGHWPLYIWIYRQRQEHILVVGTLSVCIGCKFCSFIATDENVMRAHIASSHASDSFRSLTYEELRSRFSHLHLPPNIYQCSYCGHYVRGDDTRNPTSLIAQHVREECQKADRRSGKIQLTWSVVTKVDEIRKNILHNLPHIYRCRFCSFEQEAPSPQDMARHLIERHRDRFCELR